MERVWQKSVLTYSVLEEDLSTVGKLLQEFFIDESAVTEDGERECFLTKNGDLVYDEDGTDVVKRLCDSCGNEDGDCGCAGSFCFEARRRLADVEQLSLERGKWRMLTKCKIVTGDIKSLVIDDLLSVLDSISSLSGFKYNLEMKSRMEGKDRWGDNDSYLYVSTYGCDKSDVYFWIS